MKKILTLVLALFCLAAFAEIKMPRIFSNNMLLQRDTPVKVWGWADANSSVEVKFAGQTKKTKADAQGKWMLSLSPLKANGDAVKMEISENGKAPFVIENVLVGEVWIAGGQSNMAYGTGNMNGAEDFINEAKNYKVRYFNQPHNNPSQTPMDDCIKDSVWFDFQQDPNAVRYTSAVANIFARELNKELNVPVAIVQSAISGTNMYSWLPKEIFDNDPMVEHERKSFQHRLKHYNYEEALAKWQKDVDDYEAEVKKAKEEGKPAPQRHYRTTETFKPRADSPDLYRTPSELYNARIYPIKNFAARGFLWYQGENDGGMKTGFKESNVAMIKAWRDAWGNPKMPFIATQLPSWGTPLPWPEIREQQTQACIEAKYAGIAVTLDTGDEGDIHPKEKLPIGLRLSKIALKDVYGKKDILASGPILKDVQYSNKFAKVNFQPIKGGVVCKGEPRGFELLCGDKWVPAEAKMKGNSVVLKAPEGNPDPSGVRYLWKQFAAPDVCIFNVDGIPTAPFQDSLKTK